MSFIEVKSLFLWHGKTLSGEEKFGMEKGVFSESIQQKLSQKGLCQITTHYIPNSFLYRQCKTKELVQFIETFQRLLSSGLSIIQAIVFQMSESHSTFQNFLYYKIYQQLNQGKSLYESFYAIKANFPPLFLAYILMSQRTGKLEEYLGMIKDFYQKQYQREEEKRKILRYPCMIFGFSILTTLGLILFVLPMFESLFSNYGDNLFWLTKILLHISSFLRNQWFILVYFFIILIIWSISPFFKKFHPFHFIKNKINRWYQRQEDPILFSHSLEILLKSGIDLLEAIQITQPFLSSHKQKSIKQLLQKLHSGTSISKALQESSFFTENLIYLLNATEKSQQLAVGFQEIHIHLTKKRERDFQILSQFLEPICLVFVGIFTLAILSAIYLPLFGLGDTFLY